MSIKERDLQAYDVFTNANGDIYVKIDDSYCVYLGNITKAKVDKSMFLPSMPDNDIVAVLGNIQKIAKPDDGQHVVSNVRVH